MQTMLQQLQVILQTMIDFLQFPWWGQLLSRPLDAVGAVAFTVHKAFGLHSFSQFLSQIPLEWLSEVLESAAGLSDVQPGESALDFWPSEHSTVWLSPRLGELNTEEC